jgi:hypothetical protein
MGSRVVAFPTPSRRISTSTIKMFKTLSTDNRWILELQDYFSSPDQVSLTPCFEAQTPTDPLFAPVL